MDMSLRLLSLMHTMTVAPNIYDNIKHVAQNGRLSAHHHRHDG